MEKRTSKRGLIIGGIVVLGLIAGITNNHPTSPQQSTATSDKSTSQSIPINEPAVLQAQEAAPATPAPATQAAPAPTPAPKPSCDSDHYINSAGNCVARPTAAPSAPAGATAKCADGTYSFSQTRRGTCSHHGGVATWL